MNMPSKSNDNILIIGAHDTGKTHFGGQVYGRLQSRTNFYRITSPPEDLTIFQEVLSRLNEGKSAGHTHASANTSLQLQLVDVAGKPLAINFPDYGGEQISAIVRDRRVSRQWNDLMDNSDAWVLFIRADGIPQLEDVANRGIPAQDVLERRKSESEPMVLSKPAFFIELLQILLFVRQISLTRAISAPKLTVVLSCWDTITGQVNGKTPEEMFSQKLPAFCSFLRANWRNDSFQVLGLSSTGKTLSEIEADRDFILNGPEQYGYFITREGKLERDLTLAIAAFLGKA
jgi:hypothetical protein